MIMWEPGVPEGGVCLMQAVAWLVQAADSTRWLPGDQPQRPKLRPGLAYGAQQCSAKFGDLLATAAESRHRLNEASRQGYAAPSLATGPSPPRQPERRQLTHDHDQQAAYASVGAKAIHRRLR